MVFPLVNREYIKTTYFMIQRITFFKNPPKLIFSTLFFIFIASFVLAQNPIYNVELNNINTNQVQSNGGGQFTLLSPSAWPSCNTGNTSSYAIEFQIPQALTNGDQFRVGLIPGDFTEFSWTPNSDLLYAFHIENNNYSYYGYGGTWLGFASMNYNNNPTFKIEVNSGQVALYVDGVQVYTEPLNSSITANQLKLGITIGVAASSGGIPIVLKASAAADCSGGGPGNNCSLSDAGLEVNCNDNGTPTDPSDDRFTISLNPQGANLASTYNISGDIIINGYNYGSPSIIDAFYPISDGVKNITIVDSDDPSCSLSLVVTPPSPCSNNQPPGNGGTLTWETFGNSQTTVNGNTYTDASGYTNEGIQSCDYLEIGSDGHIEFELLENPTGSHFRIGLGYQSNSIVSFDQLKYCIGINSYSQYSLYANGGWIAGGIANNGDIYKIEINQTNGIITYYQNNQVIFSLSASGITNDLYGTAIFITTPIDGIDLEARASFGCDGNPTNNICNITDAGVEVTCIDNGTPNDTSDDRFTISLNPLGSDLANSYSVSGDISASGLTYGNAIQIGGTFLIADGSKSIILIDDNDPSCQFSVDAVAPTPCSSNQPGSNSAFDWINIGDTDITENNDAYSGTNWATILLSCNEIDGTDGWTEVTLNSLPSGTYQFRFGLTESNVAFSGWESFEYAFGFSSESSASNLYGNNGTGAEWIGYISNSLQNGNTFRMEISEGKVKFYLNGNFQTEINSTHNSSTLRATMMIVQNTNEGIGLSFDASESCGTTSTDCNYVGTGSFLYPGDLMFAAFDNYVNDETDIVSVVARNTIQPGTKFIISNARYESERWFSPHGIRNGNISAQEIQYIGTQPLQIGATISFELPASGMGDDLLATNFRVDETPTEEFCVSNVGNTEDPLINISTTMGPESIFLMQGYWSFNQAYGSFHGRVLSGLTDGGVWGDVPSDIECFEIQAHTIPGSHCPYYANSNGTDLQLDAISNFALWNTNGCGVGDDLSQTGYREASEENITEYNYKKPLLRTYPNPFFQQATVEFSLPEWSEVDIQVYDLAGRLVNLLVPNQMYEKGTHTVTLPAEDWAPGIYTVLMKSNNTVLTDRIILIRD